MRLLAVTSQVRPTPLVISGRRWNGSSHAAVGGTAAGVVVLLYDHIITLPDEYRFVWKANPSFAKYAFLLNRYVVPSVMLLVLSGTFETRERMGDSSAHGGVDPFDDSDLWFRTCPLGSAVRSW